MNSIGPEYQGITLLLLAQMSTRGCIKRLSRYINAKLQVFLWRFVLEILALMDWHLISKWEGIMPGAMLLRKFRSTNNIKRKFRRWYSTYYIHFKSIICVPMKLHNSWYRLTDAGFCIRSNRYNTWSTLAMQSSDGQNDMKSGTGQMPWTPPVKYRMLIIRVWAFELGTGSPPIGKLYTYKISSKHFSSWYLFSAAWSGHRARAYPPPSAYAFPQRLGYWPILCLLLYQRKELYEDIDLLTTGRLTKVVWMKSLVSHCVPNKYIWLDLDPEWQFVLKMCSVVRNSIMVDHYMKP